MLIFAVGDNTSASLIEILSHAVFLSYIGAQLIIKKIQFENLGIRHEKNLDG